MIILVSHVQQVKAKVEVHHERERRADIEAAKNMKEKRRKSKGHGRPNLKCLLCCFNPKGTDDEKDSEPQVVNENELITRGGKTSKTSYTMKTSYARLGVYTRSTFYVPRSMFILLSFFHLFFRISNFDLLQFLAP